MRELVDKRLMLEDVKSWVAMDSYEQHLINNMSEWIENLPTVEVSDGDCISRRAALDAMKKITFPHWFECGEYLSEDTREIEIINSKKALEVIEALPSAQPEPSEITDEQAILHLQSTGWMRNHDREIYESGVKERLADDSESYDSLIPHEDDGDTISRQAAIDAIGTLSDSIFKNVEKGATYPKRQWFDGMANAESIIKDLPSVLHPEIIRCEDCIHYNKHKDCIKYQRDGFCSEWARNTYKYWYCSRAERETDD